MKKTKKRIPTILLAIRRGNREAEREILGEGFHAHTLVKKNKKIYSRKLKHKKAQNKEKI